MFSLGLFVVIHTACLTALAELNSTLASTFALICHPSLGGAWIDLCTNESRSEQHPRRAWAWTFWEADVPLTSPARGGETLELCCRCTDASYNVQPERPEPFWNKRGLNNNAWHRVQVEVQK